MRERGREREREGGREGGTEININLESLIDVFFSLKKKNKQRH